MDRQLTTLPGDSLTFARVVDFLSSILNILHSHSVSLKVESAILATFQLNSQSMYTPPFCDPGWPFMAHVSIYRQRHGGQRVCVCVCVRERVCVRTYVCVCVCVCVYVSV